MAGRPVSSRGGGGADAKRLVQLLRGDLNSLSNEAKKKYPAVREVCWWKEGVGEEGCVVVSSFISEAGEANSLLI